MGELKPCPFCGGTEIYIDDSLAPHYLEATCETCCGTVHHLSAWNIRPIEALLRRERDEAREASCEMYRRLSEAEAKLESVREAWEDRNEQIATHGEPTSKAPWEQKIDAILNEGIGDE